MFWGGGLSCWWGWVIRMEVIYGGGRLPGDWVDYLSPKEGG